MSTDYLVLGGILFLLYSGGNISLTQLLLLLALLSSSSCNLNNCNNQTNI